MIDITPHHQELAAQLAQAAVDGDDTTAFHDALYEIVAGGMTTAVAVIVLQARQLAAAGDATGEEE